MRCQWQELIGILPPKLRREADNLGKDTLQELRMRLDAPVELVKADGISWLDCQAAKEDLAFVVNTASRYSPWAAASTAQGYITAPGGHRIGLCGETVCRDGSMTGIRQVHSLCIRVARDFPDIAREAKVLRGSILILGPPGWGKTTLLRDLARQLAEKECVCVVDTREELFPAGFPRGKRMDVLTGCPKAAGIEIALRTMGPDCIAVDEITAAEDCTALLHVANCGVRLIATAHGTSAKDLLRRPVYRNLVENHIFDTLLVMDRDKSYSLERIGL